MNTMTYLSLVYDQGDFEVRPMLVEGQERQRAQELAAQGAQNVRLLTIRATWRGANGKRKLETLTEERFTA